MAAEAETGAAAAPGGGRTGRLPAPRFPPGRKGAPVGGARFAVMDGGTRVWDRPAPSGVQPWILVTDRIYINSRIPTDNLTQASVTYLPYSFTNDPRFVDMATSHTESFVMVDTDPPISAASPLPKYESALTFTVAYTASDGNGTGAGNITLWYRTGGGGGWKPWATQPAGNVGQFTFTASADGLYEFATTPDDRAGNKQSGPSANDTWTIVDTVRPGSHRHTLGQYQNRSSFTVSWAPDAGVTDIVSYTIQYNAGAVGWRDWLVNTTATSGTVAAGGQGVYQFPSKAKDAAGNLEVPNGNDTWTIVDTIPPLSHTLPLPTYEASLSFTVFWEPREGTTDIVSYVIQVKETPASGRIGWCRRAPRPRSRAKTATPISSARSQRTVQGTSKRLRAATIRGPSST